MPNGKFLEQGGLHDRILEILSSDEFLVSVNIMKKAVIGMFDAVGTVFNYIVKIIAFISDNWQTIAPIVVGIATAFGLYSASLLATAVATWIANGAAKAFFVTLLANPLTYIVLAISAVIAIIYKWVQSVGGIQNAWEIDRKSVV